MNLSSKTTFLAFAVLGCLVSILFLIPIHDYVVFHEVERGLLERATFSDSPVEYVLDSMARTLSGQRFLGAIFFGFVGVVLGTIFYVAFRSLYKKNIEITNLRQEIERDISLLLRKHESDFLEFKSSFRWDYKKNEINKTLELAVLKNIAAFLNAQGGSVLIGVDDDANVLGLENDYQTLKTKNRDGLELAFMTAVATKIGTNFCSFITVLFHEIDGDEICQILISKSTKPAYVSNGKDTKFYLRAGASARELNIKEAADYISDRWK